MGLTGLFRPVSVQTDRVGKFPCRHPLVRGGSATFVEPDALGFQHGLRIVTAVRVRPPELRRNLAVELQHPMAIGYAEVGDPVTELRMVGTEPLTARVCWTLSSPTAVALELDRRGSGRPW